VKTKPNEQLVKAACQGNVEAINALLIQHQIDVQRFAKVLCATPEDAEDALQETLWVVSRKIGTLKVATAFISWLFMVVKRECLKLLRVRQRELPFDAIPEPLDEFESSSTQVMMMEEVAIAIEALPTIYRQVLVMRDVEEMTGAEVAAALGITIASVKSRLGRARKMLRTTLNTTR
jgi:RNA polymerase sigma factor (sigma-70 family)